jgi:FkbM family methyltransferase
LNRLFPAINRTERARRQFLAIALTEGDIAIDCGANVGDITEQLCRSGATVYGFEPNPYAFKVLENRFSQRCNVHCFQQGVWDRDEVKRLYFHENSDEDEVRWSTGSSLLNCKSNILADKYVDTPVIDLSQFIRSLNARVKLLKIDVEGVEGAILRKLITTGVIHDVDHVFVETHERKIPELRADTVELRQMLKAMNLTHVNLDWT